MVEMSGEETVRRLRAEREAQQKALRVNIVDAQKAMRAAGFTVPESCSPWDMVTKLLDRNAAQKELEDGLRERLKAAEETAACFAEEAWEQLWQACMVEQDGARIIDNRCLSSYESACRAFERIGWLVSINGRLYRVTRGEWGLVKKAEDDSGSAPGEAKAIEGVPGDGDPLNDPQSPG